MEPDEFLWRHRPCKHCGGGHFDSTCIRRVIPKMQRREHLQKDLKDQGTHSVRVDEDGDVVMEEWTKCGYCVSELGCCAF